MAVSNITDIFKREFKNQLNIKESSLIEFCKYHQIHLNIRSAQLCLLGAYELNNYDAFVFLYNHITRFLNKSKLDRLLFKIDGKYLNFLSMQLSTKDIIKKVNNNINEETYTFINTEDIFVIELNCRVSNEKYIKEYLQFAQIAQNKNNWFLYSTIRNYTNNRITIEDDCLKKKDFKLYYIKDLILVKNKKKINYIISHLDDPNSIWFTKNIIARLELILSLIDDSIEHEKRSIWWDDYLNDTTTSLNLKEYFLDSYLNHKQIRNYIKTPYKRNLFIKPIKKRLLSDLISTISRGNTPLLNAQSTPLMPIPNGEIKKLELI